MFDHFMIFYGIFLEMMVMGCMNHIKPEYTRIVSYCILYNVGPPITMVYDTQITIVNGVYKPSEKTGEWPHHRKYTGIYNQQ